MAITSQQLLEQLRTQYANPDQASIALEKGIREANRGTIEGLLTEAGELAPKAYSAFNQAFADTGTSGRDMSPSQRLANAQFQASQSMNMLNQNRGVRDYYKSSINDTIAKALQAYQMGYGSLTDQYKLQYQQEQDAANQALQRAAIAAQYAAINANKNQPEPLPTTEMTDEEIKQGLVNGTLRKNSYGEIEFTPKSVLNDKNYRFEYFGDPNNFESGTWIYDPIKPISAGAKKYGQDVATGASGLAPAQNIIPKPSIGTRYNYITGKYENVL